MPSSRTDFKGVIDIADTLFTHLIGPDRVFITVEILLEVVPYIKAIQLVDFKAGLRPVASAVAGWFVMPSKE